MTVIVGTSTPASGPADNTGCGFPIAQVGSANASGTLTSISALPSTTANVSVTSLQLAIFADGGGHTGTLLAKVTVAGNPVGGVTVTGTISQAVTVSTTYWLGFLQLGGSGGNLYNFNDAVSSGGSNVMASSTSVSDLGSVVTWDAGPFAVGPLTIYASGTAGGGPLVLQPTLVMQAVNRSLTY